MIIQIIGLPGAGKTTLASAVSEWINAIHINADAVRKHVSNDLGFSLADRVEQARRLGGMARMFQEQGHNVVVDFVCPTKETCESFGKPDFLIWVDRVKESKFQDTNAMWEIPSHFDLRIPAGLTVKEELQMTLELIGEGR